MFESATIELDRAPIATYGAEPSGFAEEFLIAVSCGWDSVIRLLESCEPDPDVRTMLQELLDS